MCYVPDVMLVFSWVVMQELDYIKDNKEKKVVGYNKREHVRL